MVEKEQGRWSKKGEKSNTEVEIFYCSFSPNVRLPWQRDREGMCGMADESPVAVLQTDDSSILPWKAVKT